MLNTRCAYLNLKPFARLNGSKDPAISNKAMDIVTLDKNHNDHSNKSRKTRNRTCHSQLSEKLS